MNTPHVIRGTPSTHGDVLTAISDGMVALLKEFYGRGPTRAKSYYQDDLVVCVLRGGFSRVEETLLEGGRGPAGHPAAHGASSSSTVVIDAPSEEAGVNSSGRPSRQITLPSSS
jgi:hypothetical protein